MLLGSIAGWAVIIASLLLQHTKRGKLFAMRMKRFVLILKYEKLLPWFTKHEKNGRFKFFENARWFPWYGKRVVYVKPKDASQLTATQADVKEAIKAKDYQRALDIVNGLPVTTQTITIKQVIEAKLK